MAQAKKIKRKKGIIVRSAYFERQEVKRFSDAILWVAQQLGHSWLVYFLKHHAIENCELFLDLDTILR
jgi:hypothetical protein